MDHNLAVESHAVERYLLDEMEAQERDGFEEHYFTCAECERDVRAGAQFRANAREVLRRPEQFAVEQPRRGWFSWASLVPVAASLALLAVVAYQNVVVIPTLRMPQSFAAPVTLDGVTRGSVPQIAKGQPLYFVMGAPAAVPAGVTAELTTESGKLLTRGPAAKPAPDQPYQVFFPGEYAPGRYLLIVRDAASGQELAQNKFEIVAKETDTR